MTILLKIAIEELILFLKQGTFERVSIISKLKSLQGAYLEHRDNMTETSKRIDFLHNCLEAGNSKREAARMLVTHDPRVGQKTAETLVYMNFSGQYQTTMKGRRKLKSATELRKAIALLPNITDDESIL